MIISYRTATSSSDQNNLNIIAWLDSLQASIQSALATTRERAFKLKSRTKNTDDSDPESSDGWDKDIDIEVIDADETLSDPEPIQSLPNAAEPLGLIANLSLSNIKAKTRGHNRDVASIDTVDDDNVVC